LHATEWHIDPHKVGVLGFSAGGHLVAATSNHFDHRVYRHVDAADAESCRPDFAVALYPGHLSPSASESDAELAASTVTVSRRHGTWVGLNPDIHVTRETPPTFLVQAEDDPVDSVANSMAYYAALVKAGVPAELHLYAHGGHAFGLRRTKQAITNWPQLVEAWMRTIKVISE
jgi:acetyl esterase/lipase